MPGYRDFLPTRESELVVYTNAFAAQLAAKYAAVGRSPQDAADFQLLNDEWVEAYRLATGASTRTSPAIQRKRAARDACVRKLRELAAQIQHYPGTNDSLRADFQLRIAMPKTPIGVPSEVPRVVVGARHGNSVDIRLFDSGGRCARPEGAHSAWVYVYVGDEAPQGSIAGWTFYRQTTRMRLCIDFAAHLRPGSTVWITAAYCSPSGQLGQGCPAVQTFLAGGVMCLGQNLSRRAA